MTTPSPENSPAAVVTHAGRGQAAPAPPHPTPGAGAATTGRTDGTASHPGAAPSVPDPAPETLSPGAGSGKVEPVMAPAREALPAGDSGAGGQGNPFSRVAEREEGAGPGVASPGPATTSPPEPRGVLAGMLEGGPGSPPPAPAAGTSPALEPGGAGRNADAAPPVPSPGLRGKDFLDAVRAEKAKQAKGRRNRRGRQRAKRGYQPGGNRRMPPPGGAS